MATVGSPTQSRICVRCNRTIPNDAFVCPYCGLDYRYQQYPPSSVGYHVSAQFGAPQYGQYQFDTGVYAQKTALPIAGGICTLIAGIIGIIFAIIVVWLAGMIGSYDPTGYLDGFESMLWGMALFGAIFELIAIFGGVFAIMRKLWAFALIGSIFAIIGGALISTISLILGIVGLILIAISKKEFVS